VLVPGSTYRLQLNAELGFAAAAALVPYLADLGVTHVYASPIFAAGRGSRHGYDVTDPTRLNPELGTAEELDRLCAALHERGMGMVLDIVPNHQAVTADNPAWWDVLANGESSAFAPWFDIDWHAPGCDGCVVLPVLGTPLERVLERGELAVEADARGPVVRYFEHVLPLSGNAGGSLADVLARQHYRLVEWRAPLRNYRRFFDIGGLVGVRVEDPAVFDATHRLIVELVRSGRVDGLRVDHVDGLRDPQGYLERLQQALGGDAYVVVEKILHEGESLRESWPIAGTTGYEFLDTVGGLFVDGFGADALGELYADFVGVELRFNFLAQAYKLRAVESLFAVEMDALQDALVRVAADDPQARSIAPTELRLALVEVTVSLPVYRTYIRDEEVADEDRRWIELAVARARGSLPAVARPALAFLRRVLLLERSAAPDAWLELVLRWQQLTGPVVAKGVEDTALYVYNRLLSRNEVGSDPASYTVTPETFHRRCEERRARQPHGLSATSTHDTKRSEDVRARVSVLSELPEEWAHTLARWSEVNERLQREVDGRDVPDRNEELLVYQMLLGALPLREEDLPAFPERVQAYVVKAAREAKVWTSWLDPDRAYEEALTGFVADVLDQANGAFWESFTPFQHEVARLGAFGSLSQLVLKMAAPGVPDLYQGTERWSLRMVDPDNRAPVDFAVRAEALAGLRARWDDRASLAAELLEGWQDGRVKILVTHACLLARGRRPALFADGEYVPLEVEGAHAERVCALARVGPDGWAVALAPRLVVGLGGVPLGEVWGDTAVVLPPGAPVSFDDAITGAPAGAKDGRLAVAEVLAVFPVALLEAA
jgi:(1->4)-alpha-D-glucan 1-alpha-D-glucosylmutase